MLNHRKQGFASPMAMWLRSSMRGFTDAWLSPQALAKSGVLVPAQVQRRIADHQARRALNDKHIFSVLMFERWWRGLNHAQGSRREGAHAQALPDAV